MHTVRNHVRKIRTVSDECLYKISEEVTEFSSKQLSKVVGDMILTQLFNKSIGLAAPQIGINKRIIITHIKSQMYIMINPYIVWGKKQPHDFSLAMCELAWCSIQTPIKMFSYSVLTERGKIHPTQKPVALYKWLLKNYAKPGDKILDTHVGSASSLIACYQMGFEYLGFEIDEEYYAKAKERLDAVKAQASIFDVGVSHF